MTEDEYERVFWEAERQFREIICGDRLMWLNNQGIARIRQALPGGSVLDEKRARGGRPGREALERNAPNLLAYYPSCGNPQWYDKPLVEANFFGFGEAQGLFEGRRPQ